ncbi:hypothetical protein [uncultured Aeromicrobium sp.]|uniref:hypothetical protein n=1 Tax=uncultured Aeromicrobium sp. TaxID=337820 RepID=UPI0025EF4A93|nr:hypothetical protein [uncultured Aeromicrobium sp.]
MRVLGVDLIDDDHVEVLPLAGRAQAWQNPATTDVWVRYVDHSGALVEAPLTPEPGYAVAGEWLGGHRLILVVATAAHEIPRYAHAYGWRAVAISRPEFVAENGVAMGIVLMT